MSGQFLLTFVKIMLVTIVVVVLNKIGPFVQQLWQLVLFLNFDLPSFGGCIGGFD